MCGAADVANHRERTDMSDANVTIIWRVLCGIAAVYCAFNRDWVPAAIFALAAK